MTACDEHACMHAWHAAIDLSGASRVVYAMFEIQSCVRGHHVYKDIWTPFVGETLSCEREEDNTADPYAVAVKKKFGRRMPVVVGHMPRRVTSFNSSLESADTVVGNLNTFPLSVCLCFT